ncbi:uncharacterized protein LOC113546007 [Pangasianodon hypophthalmus]|uniref:uncharacterized protein LOC113546007 n=1 Tax=Pangasianodon hypophthalmus TaxID=310915 RepID=UPI002307F49E|nr:uncharacterized protein LOC113546007 [Pangasianodon hypophthalmus]XP_034162677.2 uncharacterized protein LOC113546007 [Pangasianodon hypophthalmus]
MTHTRRIACLIFLIVFLEGCVCGLNPSVWQTPRIITAESGERVNISCHFTLTNASQQGRWKVAWRKNNDTVFLNGINISDFTLTDVNKSHTLTLSSVNESHSGIYYCTVWQDVPHLMSGADSTGTQLIVNSISPDTTADQSVTSVTSVMLVMWAAPLALALIIGCFTSVTCCFYRARCMRRKKENQPAQKDDEGVVYAAVNIHKPREKKNTQEASEAPDAGCAPNAEVLYSEIRIKS